MGPGGCGKSALAVRLLARRFISEYCPVLEGTYYRLLNNGEFQVGNISESWWVVWWVMWWVVWW